MSASFSEYGTVLVTGANGMLGQDLCPMLEDSGYEVIETDIDNLDITNEIQVRNVISDVNPDYVIHCAAYTNVDKAEEEKDKAELINGKGTENIAKACNANNSCLVYISTDYVFDGTKNSPYEPDDKTNPLGVYGITKFHGEQAVQKYCPKHYITRTSWLYGHHGKNFVETMISLAGKPELKVVHTCGGGNTSWYGFAKEIFEKMNLDVNLLPCTTEEYPRPAKRPKYSIMNNHGLLRDWKLALKEYIELRID